jgi:LPPG:FO 2-phospho-L-lactate transferase
VSFHHVKPDTDKSGIFSKITGQTDDSEGFRAIEASFAANEPSAKRSSRSGERIAIMRITALAGGIGGARFLRGVLAAAPDAEVTVIGNTGDDIWVHGLRVCPDLDTVMYTLGGGISAERGWGREGETFTVKDELAAYGVEPTWFGLGDKDIATHLIRTQSMQAGFSLTEITAALCERWQPGVRLLPMSDDRAETNVIVDDPSGATDDSGRALRIAIHFQEWWIKYRALVPAHGFVLVGVEQARPAPGVIQAIEQADVVLLPPSNPVVSIGTILQVPGIADALRSTSAPVVGLSPIVGGAPVRGMADACLTAIGLDTTALAVAAHYGARSARGSGNSGGIHHGASDHGLIDGWLVDTTDAGSVPAIEALGIRCRAVPLMMTDLEATRVMAVDALSLANRP